MGTAWRDAGSPASQLLLETACRYRGCELVHHLLQALSGNDQARAGDHFLRHLLRLLDGNILVIWDGLRSHHGSLVKKFVRDRKGRLEISFLPAHAPELNAVEYLWGYWKMRELPNFCAADYRELSVTALSALKRIRRRRSTLVSAFWKQAELAL